MDEQRTPTDQVRLEDGNSYPKKDLELMQKILTLLGPDSRATMSFVEEDAGSLSTEKIHRSVLPDLIGAWRNTETYQRLGESGLLQDVEAEGLPLFGAILDS